MRLNKQTLYGLFLILLMYLGYMWRSHKSGQVQELKGNTMGTTYTIKYLGEENYQPSIDSLLLAFNQSMSTYIPTSEISQFNANGTLRITSAYFFPVISTADEIYRRSHGAFDPTVMPLVNAWGFGFEKGTSTDPKTIDSLLQYVGFRYIRFTADSVIAQKKGVMLDFSAIAKGYGVDVVASFLQSKGVLNYMVEIGGELACMGKNDAGRYWTIEINNPSDSQYVDQQKRITQVRNRAIATSGNYLNFYVDEKGVKRAHTIHPATGYPVEHSLLSASVKAKNCALADGYATALMVLGVDKGKALAASLSDIDVLLIYDQNGTPQVWHTPNFFSDEEN